jgi:hypothetical protein
VETFELPITDTMKKRKDQEFYRFMFELILMRDYEDVAYFREEEDIQGKMSPH